MSIGAALAGARQRSGLSVSELSRRTRIRQVIIEGIERDDYSGCGGDFYARGHIRAIARAVGTDPRPLIDEYDTTHRTEQEISETVVLHPDEPPEQGDAPPGPRRPAAPRHAPPGPRHAPAGGPTGRWPAWALALGIAAVAVLGSASYYATAATGHAGAAPATGTHATGHPHPAPAHHTATQAPSAAPTPTHTPTPRPTHTAAPVEMLTPASTAAFGPGGVGDGDNPQSAGGATDGDPSTFWHTEWYASPAFGNLKTGTGLLLDMGRPVTVSAAKIALGSASGADLQLQVGNAAVPGDFREVASASDAGGTIVLHAAAAPRARYVLVWFTKLPTDPSGTFQASIYDMTIGGHH